MPLPSSRRARVVAAAFVVLTACAALPSACSEDASVVFGITSEIAPSASFTSLAITVRVDGDERIQSFAGSTLRFPMEIPVDDASADDLVEIELVAMQGDVPILTRSGSTTAASGRRVLYELSLESECVGIACDDGMSCQDGACVDDFAPPDDLPDYYPTWAGSGGGGPCEPGGESEVILGEGQSDYHALDEADVVQVEAGPQGGYHVWIAARLKNLSQSGSLTLVSGRFLDLDYEPAPSQLIFTFDPDEGEYCKIYGLRFRVDDEAHPIDSLLGERVEITVEIRDPNGKKASSTRTVRLSDDFI